MSNPTKTQIEVLKAILSAGGWSVTQANGTRGTTRTINALVEAGLVERVKVVASNPSPGVTLYDLRWLVTAAGCLVVNAAPAAVVCSGISMETVDTAGLVVPAPPACTCPRH